MSGTQNVDPAALEAALQQRLSAMGINPQQQQPGFQQPMQQGFGQQQMMPAGGMPQGMPQAQALLVPIELNLPDGRNCTVQLSFPGSFATNPMAMNGLIMGLLNAGYPVRAFAPRQQNGGGNWGNNGGGYQNGGGYRGGWRR